MCFGSNNIATFNSFSVDIQYTLRVPALKPWKESGNCDVGRCKDKEVSLLFRMKVLTKFAFATFSKSAC
jgi:hypothetical protein